MPKLFVAIATGQNVANLPPIINLGQNGDEILWIVSEMALEYHWVEGSNRILLKRGFKIHKPLLVKNELMVQPSQLKETFLKFVQQNKFKNREIIFVMTGGQKTAVMGIILALMENELNYRLIYQDIKPVQLRVSNAGELKFYKQEFAYSLSLEELLEVYNFTQKDDNNKFPIQLFPANNLELKDIEKIAYQQYLENPDISFLLFQLYSKFSKSGENLKFRFPPPQCLYEQFQSTVNQWYHKSFYNLVYPFNKLKKGIRDLEKLKENISLIKNEQKEKEIFNTFYKLFRDILSKYKREDLFHPINIDHLKLLKYGGWLDKSCSTKVRKTDLRRRLGGFFEKMVAFRLVKFLKQHPDFQKVIAEVWLNYPVRRKSDDQREFMEGDIFIVLKNATTIYLECKTFKITEQDIFSKIERFRQVSGFVNNSYVVIPVFTTWPPESHEYAEIFQLLENLTRVGIDYVPFTGYSHNNKMTLKDRELYIPTFEEKLIKIFKPYIV